MAETAPSAPVRTTCPYCGVGCGVVARPDSLGGAEIEGDKDHPANFGRLCVKGSALGETLGLDGRLLYPQVHGQRSTWHRALNYVAEGLKRTREQYGAGAIAFYLSGQLLTEDYYVANKLAKGFIGTSHVDTNSRLCMASSVAGHRRAFGSDTVPNVYEDIEEADLIILVGSNAAWCHPVLFQRMQAARQRRRTRVVNIDPRRTATSEGADLQLSIRPGMDGVLFSWLLTEIFRHDADDKCYLAQHVSGLDAALQRAHEIAPNLEEVAAKTGLAERDIALFCKWFVTTPRSLTCYSQGVNQSAQGTDKVNAILNCHLVTGRIGKPGSGPLSLTGQPNAMGGREVGGLANMLAAHMGYSPTEIDRVRRFWAAPHMAERPGLKAVEMFEAIESGGIKALWIMHTNPAVSLPRADALRDALRNLDLLVVSDAWASTDTTEIGAHVLLPAAAWGEKDGTVTNSERRISRQRRFLPSPGEAMPDWWQICAVAKRLGYEEAFSYETPAEIFREHALLSDFENQGARDFDIGALARLSDGAYDHLSPTLWPRPRKTTAHPRFFSDGLFFSNDRRARLIAIDHPALKARTSEDFPFLLNTGRLRDQWHTMTRTGRAPKLAQHSPQPFVAMHPQDAARLSLRQEGYAWLRNDGGQVTLQVFLDEGQTPGSVFVPIHWNDSTAGQARIGAIVQAGVDPYSGQPESKATPIAIEPIAMLSEGFLVARQPLMLPRWLWHARLALPQGAEAVLFASPRPPQALHGLLNNYLGERASRVTYEDAPAPDFRTIVFRQDRLDMALFIAETRNEATFNWVVSQFGAVSLASEDRRALLAGRSPGGGMSLGPLVCSCFGVRRETIAEAIRGGSVTMEAIGASLRAGTNCGSCQPEIRKLIGSVAAQPLAAE